MVALAVTACSGGGTPAASPSPTPPASPTASPTPEVTLAEVHGTVEVSVVDASVANGEVYPAGTAGARRPEPDPAAINAFSVAVADWLDRHLDDLQRTGAGAIDPASSLAAQADPAALALVTSALASPERPVAAAAYAIEIAARTQPEWAVANVSVTGSDGAKNQAAFVFVPAAEGVDLVAAGPVTEAG